ncbi:MAG: SMC family ATPase [Dehalococcoidia bacterium]|nr:SMC family ATPase [Dehalococcoidia bacterium]
MIPIRLTLRNFMPYRDVQTLDFSGIHTASICGDNGSGKSAIIDAMTWALWGETRAKRDDDLIHMGEQETEVDFEFALGEQKYRVLRKHARPKRATASGQTWLHLQVVAGGGYRSIDGDTKPLTEQKIEQILHMDYDTFINSAYLRQGHADEFTTANPAKRKQVLMNILGMSRYDELEDRAKKLAERLKSEKDKLTSSLADIGDELAGLPACESGLVQAQNDLALVEEAARELENVLAGLRQQKETLEGKRAQLAQLEKSLAERTRTLVQVTDQIRQQQVRIKEHEAVLTRREEIEVGYAQFISARDQNEGLNKALSLVNRLTTKKHALEQEINRKSQELVKQHAQAQSRFAEQAKTAGALPRLKDDYKLAQLHLQQLQEIEQALQKKKQEGQEIKLKMQAIESEWRRLEKEIEEAGEKLQLLRTQKGARCPLCGCELGEDGIRHIETEFAAERKNKTGLVKTKQSEYTIVQADVKLITEQTSLEERRLAQEKARAQSLTGRLETEMARAEEAGTHLAEELSRLKQIEEQLNTRAFAAAEQEQLRLVDEALLKLDYDAARHEQVRQLYEEHRRYEVTKQKLDEAERLITREREDRERLERMEHELRSGLEADSQQKETLTTELIVLSVITADLARAESEMKNIAAQQKQVQERLGSIKGRLEYLQGLTVKKKEREEQLKLTAAEEQVYRELATAFGKKGVQALIIETAIPEIENEANRLLARMTEGRMSVKLETQRETQKGDTVETLDIKTSDELGTRNYEMFSGGEAFRINFAIRIALSRLLARRHGAPLPTLIIDEGFGTQDAAGIEKLREAITTIQDDFEKILVITHIEELRDAFPARIDVVKEADGSKISLG